jgi:hypothetical protein
METYGTWFSNTFEEFIPNTAAYLMSGYYNANLAFNVAYPVSTNKATVPSHSGKTVM